MEMYWFLQSFKSLGSSAKRDFAETFKGFCFYSQAEQKQKILNLKSCHKMEWSSSSYLKYYHGLFLHLKSSSFIILSRRKYTCPFTGGKSSYWPDEYISPTLKTILAILGKALLKEYFQYSLVLIQIPRSEGTIVTN